MKGSDKMEEKISRKDLARRRMEYYPLPLRWFKFFRYVSMILNIITGIVTIINIITVAAAMLDPETMASLWQNYPEAVGMIVPFVVAEAIMTAYIIVLCVLVFIKMGELTKSAYRLIMAFLISYPIINSVSEFLTCLQGSVLYPDIQINIAGRVILTLAISGVVAFLNYIYFRKRRSLFTDSLEVEDYVIDDGSVQLTHYDECPFCHAKINGNSSFCEHCGRNFTEPMDTGKDNSRKE